MLMLLRVEAEADGLSDVLVDFSSLVVDDDVGSGEWRVCALR